MALGPIEMNVVVTRSQDISLFKQNEDNKPVIDQSNIQVNMQKKVQDQNQQVKQADNAEYHQYRYDAKEKGNGSYQENKNRNKKDKKKSDGTVTEKRTASFDIRI